MAMALRVRKRERPIARQAGDLAVDYRPLHDDTSMWQPNGITSEYDYLFPNLAAALTVEEGGLRGQTWNATLKTEIYDVFAD